MSMTWRVRNVETRSLQQRRWYGLGLIGLLVAAPALAGANEDELYSAQAGEVSRASVVQLPPAGNEEGVVTLSSSSSAEDVIQPVLEIERGKTVLLKPSYAVRRIAVGDPAILDFVVNNQSEVQLVAKAVGNTNVLIWDTANRLQASIDIHVGAVRAQLVRELQRVLGRTDVIVDMAGESVVLRGTVPNLESSEAAERVARAFFTETTDREKDAQAPKVINLLSVGGNHQVMIEIVIAEMSRGVSRALGANFDAVFRSGADATRISSLVRNLSSIGGSAALPTNAFSNDIKLIGNLIKSDDFTLSLFLEALEAHRIGKVLAEPTLVARSGELASFLVGGEVPIPVAQASSNGGAPVVTIIFKSFGVQLEFIPTVLSPERIHLQISPEVSQPDSSFGTQVAGTAVPSFRTRRAATGVELADGQSFAIAGLLQEITSTDIEQLPFLGDVPILGQFFRSERFKRDETELVILVTPRLVKPLGPQDVRLPTDDYVEPSLFEFYGLGRLRGTAAPAPRVRGLGPTGANGQRGLLGIFGPRLRVPTPSTQENNG
jgi:pilus assembly protein CpaC